VPRSPTSPTSPKSVPAIGFADQVHDSINGVLGERGTGTFKTIGQWNNEDELRGHTISLLAGHAAEVEFCQKNPDAEDGAAGDFQEARHTLGRIKEDLSDHLLKARTLVLEHTDAIRRVAEDLLIHLTLDDVEIEYLVDGDLVELEAYRASMGFSRRPDKTCFRER
jgi:hypothetical protein